MKKLPLFLTLLLLSYFLPSQTIYKDYVDGQLYVEVKPELLKSIEKANTQNIHPSSLPKLEKLFKRYQVSKVKRPFAQANDHVFLRSIVKLEFLKKQDIDAFLAELRKEKSVGLVEKVPLKKTHATPNDPSYAALQPHLPQINAPNAWNVFNGNSNITVAIVDNAVMWTHSDLVANTYTNTGEIAGNLIDDDGNGYIDDRNGFDVADWDNNTVPTNIGQDHGTHCAGIAGARTDNNVGIASIGWNIKIIPVKCSFNGSLPAVVDAGYEGIIYAAKAKARIISCSWGGSGASVVEQTVVDYAWNKGCIIIASAGNINTNVPNYPGAYNHVYCVTAVDGSDNKWASSNFGSWVDIAAPGVSIHSTVPDAGTGTYGLKSGTSMAAPLVAGLAGLMLSKCPFMSSTDVLNCISSTAVNMYTLAANAGYSVGNLLGAGRIEAFQAMNCANGFLSIAPVANFFAFPLNSCQNTPVQFYDSSLYAPANYTWTFQGGTPASSNSSSPAPQWTSPGTYSASLTVSNANGSHTKTKLNYITIAGPQSLPFTEGFQTLPFLPNNWTAKNLNYDNVFWERHTGTGGFGTSNFCAKFDNYNLVSFGDRDEMQSPKFNFSNVAVARLRYDVAYARFNATNSDTLEVKLSVNCGSTWSLVSIKGGTTLATAPDMGAQFVPTNAQWRRDTFDISAATAGQGNVMFSFINHGQYGQAIYLDNINLVFPTPTLNINPLAPVCVNSSVSLVNTSTASASYTWNFPGGVPALSSQTNPSVMYSTPGTYSITLFGVNGTSTASITRTIAVLNYPVVAANSPTICNGTTATFSLSGASNYTVNPGGLTGSIVPVNPTSSTSYTITGANGSCTDIITRTVTVLPTSPLLLTASPLGTICSGNSATLSASGAYSIYTWLPTSQTGSIVNVSPSSTTVFTITASGSSNGCSTSSLVTVNVSANPVSIISTSNSICSEPCSGIVSVNTSGGQAPYQYSVNIPGCTGLPCTNVCPGNYQLTTTDALGCAESVSVSLVANSSNIQSTANFTNSSCNTCPDGVAQVLVNGGISPYTYTWLPSGGNNALAQNLLPGCYTVSINDANACPSETAVCISFGTGFPSQNTLGELVQIFPNPTDNKVSIALAGKFDLVLYNNLGQLIVTEKNVDGTIELQLSGLAKGVYFIEISSAEETLRKKLILE